jgi:hypothetical protein
LAALKCVRYSWGLEIEALEEPVQSAENVAARFGVGELGYAVRPHAARQLEELVLRARIRRCRAGVDPSAFASDLQLSSASSSALGETPGGRCSWKLPSGCATGSGKLGTPLSRMHCAKSSAACSLLPVAESAESDESQAVSERMTDAAKATTSADCRRAI